MPFNPCLITLGKFSVDDVLPFRTIEKQDKIYIGEDGKKYKVRMSSLRYHTFAKSLICIVCGCVGNIMLLQRSHSVYPEFANRAHFNLYAKDGENYILMTKDHIHPRIKGGDDSLDNLQTMCETCNCAKGGDHLTKEEILAKVREQPEIKLMKKA